ncbi:rho family-interacting cell polarization regulator 2 isoform X1 [Leucoraja erinacea]|uniref:rho family-interacting cell polarization regulator 2 isoform X1 n=2 Tax=Leucoraja erinaceus TaxID=7782 RepID=UPI002455AC88|nr:rho family-interacting cell polarization regulator 2 isoform X1 [Leucoraja erinacea]
MDVSHRLKWIGRRPWRGRVNRRRYNKITARSPVIMSAGSPSSPGGPNGIIRSQSFAGFSTQQERRSRSHSFVGNNGILKKPQGKLKKMNISAHKNNSMPKDVHPKRMDEMYEVLKRGLMEYLEVNQAELDKLTIQLHDLRGTSRLGIMYELDKQIKAIERYKRRLEFHISKVDELYESFCMMKRLRDGASKMKQAFEMSPSTKSTRESLVEIIKTYKETTEALCSLEVEIGKLLGEFHIKMKGLAGFARLCPGDQYEIFMRYGRQQWKLKGRIEVNDRQSWDGEEIIFFPLINDLFSIKVSELKGLATHLLVGNVTCETKALFTTQPQMVAVDINDLGTVKLNLEVIWYPFDKEDLTPSTGNLHKASNVQRRSSISSQGTPETPTFEAFSFWKCLTPSANRLRLSFIDALRDIFCDKLQRSRSFSDLPSLRLWPSERLELYPSQLEDDMFDDGCSLGKSSTSLSQRCLVDGSCLPQPSKASSDCVYSRPEITLTPPEFREEEEEEEEEVSQPPQTQTVAAKTAEGMGDPAALVLDTVQEECTDTGESSTCGHPPVGLEVDMLLETNVPVGILQDPEEVSDLRPVELGPDEGNLTKQLVKRLKSTEGGLASSDGQDSGRFVHGDYAGTRPATTMSLEEALQSLLLSLEPHKEHYKELHDLDQEVMQLEDLLKPADSEFGSMICSDVFCFQRKASVSRSLTVESVLESFDFLNISDLEDDGEIDRGSECSDLEARKATISAHQDARGHVSEAWTEDTGVGSSVAGSPLPLTTGNESQDLAIIKHLQLSEHLLQQLLAFEEYPVLRDNLLDKISQQINVLEKVVEMNTEKLRSNDPILEVPALLQKHQALQSSWLGSSTTGSAFYVPAHRLAEQLSSHFGQSVDETSPSHRETVFQIAMNQMLDKPELFPSPTVDEVITIWQFSNFLTCLDTSDLGSHLARLANEVSLEQSLRSMRPKEKLEMLEAQPARSLHPLEETLKMIAFLLLEASSELVQATSSYLTTASMDNTFREKALLYYTKAVLEPNVKLQRAACAALKCINAYESIDVLVGLCRSEKDVLRQAATESLLSLGEDGRLAYEQLDKDPQEIVQLAGRRGNAVSTAF